LNLNIRVHPCSSVANISLVLCLWLQMVGFSFGADRASEADLFGGTSSVSTPTPSPVPAAMGEDAKGLDSTSNNAEKTTKEEVIQIGGTFSTEGDLYIQDGVSLFDNTASNPNILFLYLDSKLASDSRVFVRGRLFYDPTGVSGAGTSSFSNPYGLGDGSNENLRVSLQELKLSANIDRKVFFTFGRQKVKYGSAKFFNPTDFLNSQPLNFFLPSDERPGVDMVKMHIPSGTANLYAAGLIGNPSSGNPSGGYLRGEWGYDGIQDFLGAGEISLSGFLPKNQAPQTVFDLSRVAKAGFDISQAVGDFDVYFEGAAGQDSTGDWKAAYSAGAGWTVRYADRSSNTLTLQAEYAKVGAYGEFGVFSLYLPEPGSLKDITFVETNLYDFLGCSGLSRLDVIYQFTEQISGRIYGSGHWGDLGGVFHLPGQVAELGTRLDVNF